jgi:hypothetical protein
MKEKEGVKIKGNWALLIIIIVIILIILSIIIYARMNKDKTECTSDEECIKASCCHADSCISSKADSLPTCDGIMCTADCESALDCNRGSCGCSKGECVVVPNN